MDLILFDIDGTLIQSMKQDGECYVAALEEVFGFTDVDDDWSGYEYATDGGIFLEVFSARRGRDPSRTESEELCSRFVELLAAHCAERRLEEVAGANRLLNALRERDDTAVAFATGCWRSPAALKMQSAGLSFEDAPSATSDDAISREEIIEIAVRRAALDRGVSGFENRVYVGDGVWDVRACRRLGLPFLGITPDIAADGLREEGAEFLLPDFEDQALFHEYRERCSRG